MQCILNAMYKQHPIEGNYTMEYLVRCHCGLSIKAADMLDALIKGHEHQQSAVARLVTFCEPHVVQSRVSVGA